MISGLNNSNIYAVFFNKMNQFPGFLETKRMLGEIMTGEMKKKVVLVMSLSGLNVCWGLMCAMQAPFIPKKAASKGATATQFGGVFGIIHLAIFITSPLMGTMVSKLGLTNIFKSGLFLSSSCSLMFGFLTYVTNTSLFLVMAYTLRFLGGAGGAMIWTSLLALLLAR